MIRRCVEKFPLVLLMVIGRLLCAPRFGRQTTARPTSAACTASRCRGGCVNRLQANVCSAFAAEDANHLTAFFKKALQLLGLLRRDPVGQRISMKIGVITQAVPRTIWFTRLRNTVLFTRGVVVPRIVASDT